MLSKEGMAPDDTPPYFNDDSLLYCFIDVKNPISDYDAAGVSLKTYLSNSEYSFSWTLASTKTVAAVVISS